MVYDVNSIDIIGERNDGGIDLFIISSGKLEDSVEQQTLLLDKIENLPLKKNYYHILINMVVSLKEHLILQMSTYKVHKM